jgi:hypothetical protein
MTFKFYISRKEDHPFKSRQGVRFLNVELLLFGTKICFVIVGKVVESNIS